MDCLHFNDFQHLLVNISNMTIIPCSTGTIYQFPSFNTAPKGWTTNSTQYLYVRPCYEERLQMIRYLLSMGDPHSNPPKPEQKFSGGSMVTITGNPGIGKSYFLIYLIAFILWKVDSHRNDPHVMAYYDRDIVYSSGPSVFYSFNPTRGTITKNKDIIMECLDYPKTWFLVNAADETIPSCSCRVISAASPKRISALQTIPGGRDIRKISLVRWMPIWTHEEVNASARYLYPNLRHGPNEDPVVVGTARCVKRYELYGGIARIIFARSQDEDLIDEEKYVLDNSSPSDIIESVVKGLIMQMAAQRFVYHHIEPRYLCDDESKRFTNEELFERDYEREEKRVILWMNDRIKEIVWSNFSTQHKSQVAGDSRCSGPQCLSRDCIGTSSSSNFSIWRIFSSPIFG